MVRKSVLGGNLIQGLGGDLPPQVSFADHEYRYFLSKLADGKDLKVEGLDSFSVFVKSLDPGVTLQARSSDGEVATLGAGEALQVEGMNAGIKATGGGAVVLVAGVTKPSGKPKAFHRQAASEIKKVTKPWGHELWIPGDHPSYAFKEIFIKKGTKTSLQFHRQKRETNVLFAGTARLHYCPKAGLKADDVTAGDIATTDLDPVSSIDVTPNTVHRLEAMTDVLLYEVSTPHLDDVVRLQDDAGRSHGRIAQEHQAR